MRRKRTLVAAAVRPSGALDSFPGSLSYRSGFGGVHARLVRELSDEPADPHPFTERHLQCVWFDSLWRPSGLCTSEGEPVTVDTPGRWNLEAGPDFLDAVLTVGAARRKIRGDVEIHIRPSDWRHHGHEGDPRYRRLVALVTYHGGTVSPASIPPGAVQIALASALKARPSFSFDSIDLSAYPYQALNTGSAACSAPLSRLSPDVHGFILESAGQERLRLKSERLRAALRSSSPEEVLYEEIMAALGYKHNRSQFRELARRLPVHMLRQGSAGSADKAYGMLLGSAGLLPVRLDRRWDSRTRAFVRTLWNHAWKQTPADSPERDRIAWRLAGIRPANHPIRRLAAAAALFTRQQELSADILSIPLDPPQTWLESVSGILSSAEMAYWRDRLSFSGTPQKNLVALLGTARISAIIANVMVPFMAASGRRIERLLPCLPPEDDNVTVRHTANTLFGRDHNPALYASGLRQHGLLQIFTDFCLTDRSACRDCRFPSLVERLSHRA